MQNSAKTIQNHKQIIQSHTKGTQKAYKIRTKSIQNDKNTVHLLYDFVRFV